MSQTDRQRARQNMREKKSLKHLRRAQRLDQLGARLAQLVQLRERTVGQLDLRIAEAIAEMSNEHRATVADIVKHAGGSLDRREVTRLKSRSTRCRQNI
ncbi:hypothetical protein [Nocardioides perillae]|uniref:Uncharacterized protein n=1 Tax=Nocardioides perillae TaxID=1119534 RepID=A0A7Y9UMC6_9ACTN|nr:hypothetical protein [Nocardioides perillae]NYG55286.1 hypothetical protein [Nocardioides perillae]